MRENGNWHVKHCSVAGIAAHSNDASHSLGRGYVLDERRDLIVTMADVSAPHFHPILADASDGQTFTMLGTTMRLIATAAATGGRYTVFEQVTPAGWGPPRHIHSREDEIIYILEGSYELHVGDERRTLSAGASAVLPRGIPHGFRNVASTPSRLICVITPGGLEEYFLAVARSSPPPALPQLIELARPFGLTLLQPGA